MTIIKLSRGLGLGGGAGVSTKIIMYYTTFYVFSSLLGITPHYMTCKWYITFKTSHHNTHKTPFRSSRYQGWPEEMPVSWRRSQQMLARLGWQFQALHEDRLPRAWHTQSRAFVHWPVSLEQSFLIKLTAHLCRIKFDLKNPLIDVNVDFTDNNVAGEQTKTNENL